MPAEPKKKAKEDTDSIEWKRIHQPWVLPVAERPAAYDALVRGHDFQTLILNSPGTRQMMSHGPEYGKLISDMKDDSMALDRAVLSGQMFAIHAAGILANDLKRRQALPTARPEVPPANASEAKAHATKLFAAKRFAHAADMYAKAIALLDIQPPVRLECSTCAAAGGGAAVQVRVVACARSERQLEDEQIGHTVYANLAACRMKQHRWEEAIEACDGAIALRANYAKAMLRRGQAKRMLKEWDGARRDAELAVACAGAEGDAGLANEITRQATALSDEITTKLDELRREALRHEREVSGVELGAGEKIYGEDFDHVLRHALGQLLAEPIVFIDDFKTNMIGMCRAEAIPKVPDVDYVVEASVRSRGAKRYLFYNIDISFPWRGLMYKRDLHCPPSAHHDGFRGQARMSNITHYTTPDEWNIEVMERPVQGEMPTCTPCGHPIEPMMAIDKEGRVRPPSRELPETQATLLTVYGPKLMAKLKPKVVEAIEYLREWLGEYRILPAQPPEAPAATPSEKSEAERAEVLAHFKPDPPADDEGGEDGAEVADEMPSKGSPRQTGGDAALDVSDGAPEW